MQPTIRPTNLSLRFGGEAELNAMLLRLAALFDIPDQAITQFSDVRSALLVATQWMITYGAMPARHLYLIPANQSYKSKDERGREITHWRKKYSTSPSYEWRMASAHVIAEERAILLRPDVVEIEPEEIARLSTRLGITDGINYGPYHPEDVLSKARILVEGLRTTPNPQVKFAPNTASPPSRVSWHYGWWKKNGRKEYNEDRSTSWKPDSVPYGRTRLWLADKRALSSAYGMDFELRPLPGWLQLDDRQRLRTIHEEIENPLPTPEEDRIDSAMPASRPGIVEEPDPADPTNPLTLSVYA